MQSGTDSSIVESEAYLDSIIDTIITGLQGQGYEVSLTDGPNFETISGDAGAIFDLTWPDSPGVKLRIGLVVDGEEDRYYIITCSVAKPFFDAYSPLFQQMIVSLEALSTEPISFTSFQYQDYRLDLPTDWPVLEDQNVGGESIDLIASGPQIEGFQTNINVVSGKDDEVRGDSSYLWDQVNRTIDDLTEKGYLVVLDGDPQFVQVDGRPAVLFTLRWESTLDIKQRIGVVVDEELGKYYVVTCSVHQSRYDLYASDFDSVIDSFVVVEEPEEDTSTDSSWLYLLTGIGVVAAIALGMLLFIRTRKK